MVTSASIHGNHFQHSTPNNVSNSLTHVLFIDDNKADNYLVNAFIELDKVPVIPHFQLNAIHAMNYLMVSDKSDFPDIIFVDINMPLKDGFEFVEDFSRQFPHSDTVIYIMSSSIRPTDKERIKDYSAIEAYVEKPVTTNFLAKLLQPATILNT